MSRRGKASLSIVETLQQAFAAHQSGRYVDAKRLYRAVLASQPDNFDALHLFAVLEAQNGRFLEAEKLAKAALKVGPVTAEFLTNYARILRSLGRQDDALATLDRALAMDPQLVVALANRGALVRELGRPDEALACYDKALAIVPRHPDISFNRGNALLDLGRVEDALAAFDAIIAQNPGYVDARISRASALRSLHRLEEARAELDRIIAREPRNVDALNGRAAVLQELGHDQQALADLNTAILANPNYAPSYYCRGNLLLAGKMFEQAAQDFGVALRLDADTKYALGNFVNCRQMCCQWDDLDQAVRALGEKVRAGKAAAQPFSMLSACASEEELAICTQRFVSNGSFPAPSTWSRTHDRIRVAYVSADFRAHATTYLTAGLFEQHDRDKFEVFGISLTKPEPGPIFDRLSAGFDRFIDVKDRTDADIVATMRELEIDIAVDLMGHTQHSRSGIYARRCAPVQINYLGYPGTSGAAFIDYIFADRVVIPEDRQVFYTEKVVYLPDTFQVNDSRRLVVRPMSRAELGLPDDALVFCSFNNSYKLNPTMFDIWMRLLAQVPNSALWLLGTVAPAVDNLRREASRRGIDPARLFFVPAADYATYLNRYTAADLFLDTLPFNGGATVSDALWAGLPVVTCLGSTFAGRMAASLLTAVGLPELIAPSYADYEALALALARDPDRRAQLRTKLGRNNATHPLFDTARFARHVEAAYVEMWERHRRGEPPASFAVAPIAPSIAD